MNPITNEPYSTVATAPAQRVTITDPLDSDLDWSTFRLSKLGFGDTVVTIPADSQYYSGVVNVTINGRSFEVHLEAGIDLATGIVFASFQSIDPLTSLPPDVLVGFLPPEDGTGRGKGHFSFTILPKAELATGTEIRNVALISFDGQALIATNQRNPFDPLSTPQPSDPDWAKFNALNTIDAGAPTSGVVALPSESPGASLELTWAGNDDPGGSGIASYDVFVSTDGGPYEAWLTGTTETSFVYVGEYGHSYAFYSVARDNVGNLEAAPLAADATTTVTGSWFSASPDAVYQFSGSAFLRNLSVTAGTITLLDDAALHEPGLQIDVGPGATLLMDETQHVVALNVDGGNATLAAADASLLMLFSLSISGGGRLDLRNHSLIVDYDTTSPIGSSDGSSYDGITGLIQSGRNDGAWDGSGIVTSMSDAQSGLTSIGIAEAHELLVLDLSGDETGVWQGQTVDATTLLVKYTYAGDANLDGFISGDDYTAIDFGIAVPGAGGWYNGDFNYDGFISGDDYTVIDFNIAAQGPPLTGAPSNSAVVGPAKAWSAKVVSPKALLFADRPVVDWADSAENDEDLALAAELLSS